MRTFGVLLTWFALCLSAGCGELLPTPADNPPASTGGGPSETSHASPAASPESGREPSAAPPSPAPANAPAPTGAAASSVAAAPSAAAAPASAADPELLAAIERSGGRLTRDAQGQPAQVDWSGTTIDDAALPQLLRLPALKSVILSGTNITDAGLAALAGHKGIINLDLRDCRITNAGLAHLEAMPGLRALQLSGKNGACTVDDDGMSRLIGLTNLKVLALDFLWISEQGLERLQPLANLEQLLLAQTLVGDEAVQLLPRQFPKLKKLRLARTQVTGGGLAPLSELPQLEDLDLSECSQVFDDGMEAVGALSTLKRLNLWRVQITDAGVQKLTGLTQLEYLNLDNTQLTDASLSALSGMTRLTFLHLGSTAITDAGLVHLEPLAGLKDLVVTRTPVTEDGARALQTKLPQTRIQTQFAGDE